MPEKLRLVGRRIVAVRPMTDEEKEREGWSSEQEVLCAVLDNGGLLYSGCVDDGPGQALAQYDGELWEVSAEAPQEVPASHRRPPPPPSGAEKATTALAVVFTLSALLVALVSVFTADDFTRLNLIGAGALGQGAAASCLWILRAFIRAGSTS